MITKYEARCIAEKVAPIFDAIANEYDERKYPLVAYRAARKAFSALPRANSEICGALVWKWGHTGKLNFPSAHKHLIREVEKAWPRFVESSDQWDPARTFSWWRETLARRQRFITVAFITHLVHHEERTPIVDQHNFRAMNSLIRDVRPTFKAKKKPSLWEDVTQLQAFISALKKELPGRSFSDIDRFLMMYGRSYVSR